MKKLILIVLILTICLTGQDKQSLNINAKTGSVPKNLTIIKSHPELLPQITGFWVNQEYINLLKTTKSPLKAAKTLGWYPFLRISKENHNKFLWKSADFHQGLEEEILDFVKLSQKNYYGITSNEKNEIQWYFYIEKFPVTVGIKCLNFKDGKAINFIKVNADNIYELANNLILSGVYQDDQEKKYVFNRQSKAIWPNDTFEYIINLDPSFDAVYDSFTVLNNEGLVKTNYSFEIKNNRLYLFRTFDSETSPALDREKEPFLKLEKIK